MLKMDCRYVVMFTSIPWGNWWDLLEATAPEPIPYSHEKIRNLLQGDVEEIFCHEQVCEALP